MSAAIRVFSTGGIEGATVSRIVDEATVGRNTFYEHFRSVEELLESVLADAQSVVLGELERATKGARTPTERLRALARAWFNVLETHPELAKLLLLVTSETASFRSESASAKLRAVLSDVIDDARRQCVVSRPSDELRMGAAVASMRAMALRVLALPRHRVADAPEVLVDVLIRIFR